jgi:hypothetical protein
MIAKLAVVGAAGLVALLGSAGAPGETVTVYARTGTDIQNAIDSLPPAGGKVSIIATAAVVVSQSIVIDRDNVTVAGEGTDATLLRLKAGANVPVFVVGQSAAQPTMARSNIHITDLTINGKRKKQTSEVDPNNPALRNNGISLRKVESCSVQRVKVLNCASGGLVTELGCRRMAVRQFESRGNQFDGLAAYETEDSTFAGLYLHDNGAAGLSFDIRFNHNVVADSIIASNATVGVFMRDARDNLFHGLQVRASGQHGLFLAQVDTDTTKPAAGNTFLGLVVSGSAGAGLRVNDASCVNNLVVGSQFIDNSGGCLSEAAPGLVETSGTVCR